MGLALADESFIGVYFELVIIGEFFIGWDVTDRIDKYTRFIVDHLDSGLAIGLNSFKGTSQLWFR